MSRILNDLMKITLDGRNESGMSWLPKRGEAVDLFIQDKIDSSHGRLTSDSLGLVVDESLDILAHCVDPSSDRGTHAVLVVGNVQSGKTLSFTALAALANDNGFGLVIVLAGSTRALEAQSEARLAKDLGIKSFARQWSHFQHPSRDDEGELKNKVDSWKRYRNGQTLLKKPAVIVTVIKHYKRITDTADVLSLLGTTMEGVPTLIIDDESDQASLNTKARENLIKGGSKKSTTYDAILSLRSAIPNHTYVQYTATPQANLLLAVEDVLDPKYVKVITAGDAYTGGEYFFKDRLKELVIELDATDACDPKNMLQECPDSLERALTFFVLGVAATVLQGDAHRSMMIQASQDTMPHATYYHWVERMLHAWPLVLQPGGSTELHDEFEKCFLSLSKTCPNLPDFSEVMKVVPEVCGEIQIRQVNSVGDERKIDWDSHPYWILVGGMKLDRGFTVEGLTVTYMPRRLADNSDTIQQRARFFGYRDDYAGLCRIFLLKDSISAFTDYVDDELQLRNELATAESGSLKNWKRKFFLSRSIRQLTRSSVVSRRAAKRISLDEGWIALKRLELEPNLLKNNSTVDSFIRKVEKLAPFTDMCDDDLFIDNRKTSNRNVSLVIKDLGLVRAMLLDLSLSDVVDRTITTALCMLLDKLEQSHSEIRLVGLNNLSVDGQKGRSGDSIRTNLFVGRSPQVVSAANPLRYSGDRAFFDRERLTIQVRNQLIIDDTGSTYDVRWLAFHFPRSVANDFVIESI